MTTHNSAAAVEYRAVDGFHAKAPGENRTVAGYAIRYNSPTLIGPEGDPWSFIEVIAPGAANAAIKGDIRALVDHDTGRVIGRTKSGTLRLTSDETGILAEIDLPDTSDGTDLYALVQRGDISGMSFGFMVTKQTWDETVAPAKRTVEAIELYEVSAVAFPAYQDTTLSARSLEASRRERESAREAKARREADAAAARRRVAERKAKQEQIFRGIRQDDPAVTRS